MRVTIIIYPQASFYNYYLYKKSVYTSVAARGFLQRCQWKEHSPASIGAAAISLEQPKCTDVTGKRAAGAVGLTLCCSRADGACWLHRWFGRAARQGKTTPQPSGKLCRPKALRGKSSSLGLGRNPSSCLGMDWCTAEHCASQPPGVCVMSLIIN